MNEPDVNGRNICRSIMRKRVCQIPIVFPLFLFSIGYPVVTLGFGLKSLLTHQLRLVRVENLCTLV